MQEIEKPILNLLAPIKAHGHTCLLAASGGVDSMVLVALLYKYNIKFAVAHCNFGLRNQESDDDELFVKEYCMAKKIECHTIRFDTRAYANSNRISTQMAARELRYGWFEQLAIEHGYHVIVTAHHQDDSIETVLINLSRNTGLAGLAGIPLHTGKTFRPMIGLSRQMILDYANAHKIAWREDSSNIKTDYLRNQIRHQALSLLKKYSPHVVTNLLGAMKKVDNYVALSSFEFACCESQYVTFCEGNIVINSQPCLDHLLANELSFYLLKDFGFKNHVLEEILSRSNQKGKRFFSEKYELITTGEEWIISPISKKKPTITFIQKNLITERNFSIGKISLKKMHIDQMNMLSIKTNNNKNIAYIDFDKLEKEICIRYFEHGDKIKPIGMKGKQKKLSDIFIDSGFHLFKKYDTPLICSGTNICWIAGLTLSEDFKITPATTHILKCTFAPDGYQL